MLSGVHADREAFRTHSDAHIAQDDERLRRSEFRNPELERSGWIVSAHRCGSAENFDAVLAQHPDCGRGRFAGGFREVGADLLALEARVAVVRGQAPLGQPSRPPQRDAQRSELAEVRRTFNRAALEAELLRRRVVMDRRMAVVLLRREHLSRRAQWTDQLCAGVLMGVSNGSCMVDVSSACVSSKNPAPVAQRTL